MKVFKCSASNFGSYRSLEIDFSNSGLTLIQGKTGSGKSTILDVACWALYGETAKGGNVDEVRSWTSPDEPTEVTLEVELNNEILRVVRIRGNQRTSDLYFKGANNDNPDPIRGKDLQDTQKLLNARLGMDADGFVAASYFHEFSRTGAFFTAKAKDRRETFERIASLELPARLAAVSSESRKSVKSNIALIQAEHSWLCGSLQQLESELTAAASSESGWKQKQAAYIEHVRKKAETFQEDKDSQIRELEAALHPTGVLEGDLQTINAAILNAKKQVCLECGGPKKSEDYVKLMDMRSKISLALQEDKANIARLKHLHAQKNVYAEQLEAELTKSNPFTDQIIRLKQDIESSTLSFYKKEDEIKALEHRVNSLTQLQDLATSLRGELLKRTVKIVEAETNRYLEAYFDAELRVEFSVDPERDDLEVNIKKSGYDCVYRQLSKGQRCMLRLTFSLAVMAATANKLGIHFQQLFFDEALDGLDVDLKVKAFRIFEELETRHNSVFIIEHSPELQALTTKRYLVTLDGDESTISLEEP